jgi:hypothetical protein
MGSKNQGSFEPYEAYKEHIRDRLKVVVCLLRFPLRYTSLLPYGSGLKLQLDIYDLIGYLPAR